MVLDPFFRIAITLVLLTGFAEASGMDEAVKVRVAAVSFVPKKLDLNGNADRLEELFRKAAKGGAKIAVAPEGALEGYIVNEILAGKIKKEQMRDVAVPVDGQMIQRFRKLAKELHMCLAFGFAESIGDEVYNSAVFIDHDGSIRGKYHKMQFAEGYDKAWWFNRLGAKSRAFETPYGRGAFLICNDRWNPTLARIPKLDGAQFLMIPSFGSRSKAQDEAVLNRGKENQLPVIEANVGVTLIVSQNQVSAVERKKETVTYSDITIPKRTQRDVKLRDEEEARFLRWREKEMIKRLEKTRKRYGKAKKE